MNVRSFCIKAGVWLLLAALATGCAPVAAPAAVNVNQKPSGATVNQPPAANTTPQPATNTPAAQVSPATAASNSGYQIFCRDGVCTFINGKSYSIDYPDTWKVDTTASTDLSKVILAPAEGWADITIVKSPSVKGSPMSQVAETLIKDIRMEKDETFYVISNEPAGGPWDWHIEYYDQSSEKVFRTQIYLKDDGNNLYCLYTFAEDKAYQAYMFKSVFDRIVSSFKLLTGA